MLLQINHSFSKLLFESIKFWHGAQTIILRAIICKQFYGLLKLANDVYVPKYMLIYCQLGAFLQSTC